MGHWTPTSVEPKDYDDDDDDDGVLCRTSNTSSGKNLVGTDAWAVPHLNFLGKRTPVPLSLRP